MLNERKLTGRELDKRVEAIQGLLSNKRTLVKKYGKDAEKVMYGIATKQAKSKVEDMNKDKLKELIQQSLEGKDDKKPLPKPVAKDLKKMKTNFNDLKKRLKLEDTVDTGFSGRADYGEEDKALGQEDELEMKGLEEDLDVGHQDNEPHMLKKELARAGQMIQMLYKAVDKYDGEGEVDFPQWWQAKIIKANTMLDSAFDYLDGEEMVAKIDAIIDSADEIEVDIDGVLDERVSFDDILDLRSDKKDLEDRIAQVYRDMEQEAEPEGGEVSDRYGSELDKLEGKLYKVMSKINDYDMNESKETLKEFTDTSFKGSDVIDDANERGPDMFGKGIFADLLPKGVASENDAIEALKAHDKSGIKSRMGRYAPMFVHLQYHDLEHEGEKYRIHQTQYYNSNFKDKDPSFNPGTSKITLFKVTKPAVDRFDREETDNLGTIVVKTDQYTQDLKNLPGLGKRVSEEVTKPEEEKLKKIKKELEGASKMHAGQAKKIAKIVKEKLTKGSSVEDHVDDFKDSDAKQFKGKSLKKIKQMALASFLSKQKK